MVDNGTAKYDLTIYCWPRAGGIELVAEYSTELFERATIVRLLAGLEMLLVAAASRPALRLSEMPLASDADRRQLLLDWNDTRRPFPEHQTLSELLAEQVARTPEAVAVCDGWGTLTYAELDDRANQLPALLRNLGVGPRTLVGLWVDRSAACLWAVRNLEGRRRPTCRSTRLSRPNAWQFMLDDAEVRVLVTQQNLVNRLPPHRAEEVLLDEHWPEQSLATMRRRPATDRGK